MGIPIEEGVKVTLHFSLAMEDGQVIDSNYDSLPATFTVGDGNLLPGFEETLMGLVSGSEKQFVLQPEKAFGQYNLENVQSVDRAAFDQKELQLGMVISFQNGGGELPGVITSISGDAVSVDFNHPLAGQPIVFSVRIIDVRLSGVH